MRPFPTGANWTASFRSKSTPCTVSGNCGLATRFMREVETFARNAGLHSFRVDTNFDNRYMRSLLSALGFTYCGEIFYAHGSRRAYEKPL